MGWHSLPHGCRARHPNRTPGRRISAQDAHAAADKLTSPGPCGAGQSIERNEEKSDETATRYAPSCLGDVAVAVCNGTDTIAINGNSTTAIRHQAGGRKEA